VAVFDLQGLTLDEETEELSPEFRPNSSISLWSCSGSSSASFFACH
jgi:hypothetical protein